MRNFSAFSLLYELSLETKNVSLVYDLPLERKDDFFWCMICFRKVKELLLQCNMPLERKILLLLFDLSLKR